MLSGPKIAFHWKSNWWQWELNLNNITASDFIQSGLFVLIYKDIKI